jgi:hypothetical protein
MKLQTLLLAAILVVDLACVGTALALLGDLKAIEREVTRRLDECESRIRALERDARRPWWQLLMMIPPPGLPPFSPLPSHGSCPPGPPAPAWTAIPCAAVAVLLAAGMLFVLTQLVRDMWQWWHVDRKEERR